MGSKYNNKYLGTYGDFGTYSFYYSHQITSGEGGCIVTDNEATLQRIRDARLLGVEKDTEKRYSGDRSWDFDVTEQGWRYHMSNIMAAIGKVQLSRFNDLAKKRKALAKRYVERLSRCKDIRLLPLIWQNSLI